MNKVEILADEIDATVSYDLNTNIDVEEIVTDPFEVVYPLSNQLQIDIDSNEAYKEFLARYAKISNLNGVQSIRYRVEISKSGLPNRHITLSFNNNFTDTERILFQFMFGSDIRREFFNAVRVFVNGSSQSCFFEKVDK